MSEHLLANGIQPPDTIPCEHEALLSDKKEQEKEDIIPSQEGAGDDCQTEVIDHGDSSDHLPEKTTPIAPSDSEITDKMEASAENGPSPSPVPSSKGKSPPADDSMETNEGEDEDTTNEEDGGGANNTKHMRSCKTKMHSRNLTYPSIIRTRRSCEMEKKQSTIPLPVDVKEEPGVGKSQSSSPEEDTSGEKTNIDGNKDKRSNKGRGRGGSGPSVKRHKSVEKESPNEGSCNKGTGSGRGKSTPMTRAAAAGLKGGVQFHQLPRRPKRTKTQEEGEEEEEQQDQPTNKKTKVEPADTKEQENQTEEKKETGKTAVVKSSPKVKGGRGKGRSLKGGKNSVPTEEEDTGSNKNKMIKEEIVDDQEEMSVAVTTKKKRGRPKKKESSTPVNTPTSEHKEDTPGKDMDTSQELTEPAKGATQINELLELSKNLGHEEAIDTPTPADQETPMESEDSKSKDEVGTPTEQDSTTTAMEEDNAPVTSVPDQANMEDGTPQDPPSSSGDNETVKDSDPVSGDNKATGMAADMPSSDQSQQSMSNAVPVEPTYPFPPHRYSPLDESYHHFAIPPPFLTGFPPFSNPPYPFMIPTSPHFPPQPPFPGECVPDMYPRFPEDFSRGYPMPIPNNSTDITTSTTSQVTESTSSDTSSSATTPSTTQGASITVPLPMGQGGYPVYTLPSPFGPPPIIGTGMPPPSMLPPGEWNMPPPQGPPPPPPQAPLPSTTPPTSAAAATKTTKESKFPLNFISSEDTTTSVSQPVVCPECGRQFKNNKALNGHMRLHGGFDWTRRPYQVMQSRQQQQQLARETADKKPSTSTKGGDKHHNTKEQQSTSSNKKGNGSKGNSGRQQLMKNGLKNNLTSQSSSHAPDTSRQHTGGTLADLCRAAEELERIERDGDRDPGTNKPSPLILPHERRLQQQSSSPPYTPPPILSPARSLMLLSNSAERLANAGGSIVSSQNASGTMREGSISSSNVENSSTPSKIWPQRKVSDQRQSEQEDLMNAKINVGCEFQAELPPCRTLKEGEIPYKHDNNEEPPSARASLVWSPMERLLQEDEDTVDGYLELCCSSVVPHGGRNKELALHVLHQVKGSVKEAVRLMVMGKMMQNENLPLYNFSGSKKWTSREKQLFRRTWRADRKNFKLIKNQMTSRSMSEIIEYYYSWKKYRFDEYRGRSSSRHHGEEAYSEDEGDIYVHPSSVTSTSSGSNDMVPDQPVPNQPTDDTMSTNSDPSAVTAPETKSHQQSPAPHQGSSTPPSDVKQSTAPSKSKARAQPPHDVIEGPPRGLMPAPHHIPSIPSPYGGSAPVQEYRCKYPGCNQVYTSIFALNGHIRVHGGSWYPKKPDVENMHSSSKESSSSNSSHSNSNSQPHSASHSSQSQSASQSHSASHSSQSQPHSASLSSHSASHSSQSRPSHSSHSGSHSSQSRSHSGSNSNQSHFASQTHSSSHSATTSLSKLKKEKEEEEKLRHQLEIAKTMVMDLPQPRSPAQTMVCSAHSPRPSPSHAKSSLIKNKKVSSASPSDREGHYPCNRCGRVFPKVKSRSAHMKSHIVKPVKH